MTYGYDKAGLTHFLQNFCHSEGRHYIEFWHTTSAHNDIQLVVYEADNDF